MTRRFTPTALMLGNFVVGTSILAPTGMLPELSRALGVSIRDASLLITLGAVVLCLGTPVISAATSRMDRRLLLGSSLAIVAVAQLASTLASSLSALLAARIVMLAAAAPFTPQAAGAVGLLVPAERRAGAISFIFLGWSLAAAVGMPLVATLSGRFGWRAPYLLTGALGVLSFVLLRSRMPAGLRTAPVDLRSWGELVKHRSVRTLLLLTIVLTAGQFVVLTFIGPLLGRLAGAGADEIGLVFGVFGVTGFIGNLVAARVVGSWGAYRTSRAAVIAMAVGVLVWALGSGMLAVMTLGAAIWGFGFASSNSMQQARLVASAPLFAGSAVALNSSSLYVGQALGSALGGALFERGLDRTIGYAGLGCMAVALLLLRASRPTRPPVSPADAPCPLSPERA